MRYGGEVVVDPELDALLLEEGVVDLLPVVGGDNPWDAKPAEEVLPDKLPRSLFGDHGNRFGFDPLGEVVDGYEQELLPALGLWVRAQDVNAPSSKRARFKQAMELFGWLLDELPKLLTFRALPNKGHAILL